MCMTINPILIQDYVYKLLNLNFLMDVSQQDYGSWITVS